MRTNPTIENIWRSAKTIDQFPHKEPPRRDNGPQWIAALAFLVVVAIGSTCAGMVLMKAIFGIP